MSETLDLFMWGYQRNFRILLRLAAEKVFESIKAPGKPLVLLVGVRRPDVLNAHPICIEPEHDAWPLSLFDEFNGDLVRAIAEHPLNDMIYGDAPSMEEKPEKIRRSAIEGEVRRRLKSYDDERGVVSFCGEPTPIANHYVVPVIQVPSDLLERHPVVEKTGVDGERRRISFLEECLRQLLKDASVALWRPDAGHHFDEFSSGEEIALRAAQRLMRAVAGVVRPDRIPVELFGVVNDLSQLRYEGAPSAGSVALADPGRHQVAFLMQLTSPVRIDDRRWCRKLLEMTGEGAALVTDCEHVLGLGTVGLTDDEAPFVVRFTEQSCWSLFAGSREILRVRLSQPCLPIEPVDRIRFEENVTRVFAGVPHDAQRLWEIWSALIANSGGAMVIVANDAESEARRLSRQGMSVAATQANAELLNRARRMDGALLIDPLGQCHAVGVILDGAANEACTASRGSRYNSAVRYVRSASRARMAFVLSDDQTVDIEPMLRPHVSAASIEDALVRLSVASLGDYMKPIKFLDEHRFYLNAEGCDRANQAVARLDKLPRQGRGLYLQVTPFHPDADMDDSFLY